ncbi:MAG TPA: tetratricopeptide repeat protein [Tepidisphaeraceae bacterium]|nr:tetratricopeptide repeat protein [Tepidisphaeraceae bacterium]
MPALTVQQAYALAVQHRRAGRLREAENIYRQIVTHHPNHVDTQRNLAAILIDTGRPDEAIGLYRRIVAIAPQDAEAFANLGRALAGRGAIPEAIDCCRRAVELRPRAAEAHYCLAGVLRTAGRVDEAIAAYRQAIALRQNYAVALYELADVLRQKGSLDEALATARQSLALACDSAEAHNILAIILREQRKLDESIAACRRAIQLKADAADAYVNLGLATQEQGKLSEAEAMYRRAIELQPNLVDAHNNLGIVLWEQGRADEAAEAYRAALAAKPMDAKARFNLGLLQLAIGDFASGWENHEARFEANPQLIISKFPQPLWDGSDPAGKRILVQCEQGFGDTFQFIRYAPLLADRGARVIVRCPPELRRLLSGQRGIEQVISTGDAIPEFDAHVPLLSLPRLFGTTIGTIPAHVPYLKADPEQVAQWRVRLAKEPGQMKVGLVWAGRPRQRVDQNRSVPPQILAPLADASELTWVSLQKDRTELLPDEFHVIDWTSELADFADTAALISALDLVMSIDTGVAHLSGALGKPTWVLLMHIPDWRWMLGGSESAWYPTMRLFRQPVAGDWETPVRQMAELLLAWHHVRHISR